MARPRSWKDILLYLQSECATRDRAKEILRQIFVKMRVDKDEAKIPGILGAIAGQPWFDGIPQVKIELIEPGRCHIVIGASAGDLVEGIMSFECAAEIEIVRMAIDARPAAIYPLHVFAIGDRSITLRGDTRPQSVLPPELQGVAQQAIDRATAASKRPRRLAKVALASVPVPKGTVDVAEAIRRAKPPRIIIETRRTEPPPPAEPSPESAPPKSQLDELDDGWE